MLNWTVTSDYDKRGTLSYFVEDSVTGERKGTFDCEQWAKEMAEELNTQDAKYIIREDPGGNIALRLKAVEYARAILGPTMTTGDLYRWADKI